MKNAIILCSGGIDSVVTSYYVKNKLKYNQIIILFFDYGQRSLESERRFSKKCARDLGGKFIEIKLDFIKNISGSLINVMKKHKKVSRKDLKDSKSEGDKYYVPCRNSLFLMHVASLVESFFVKNKKVYDIFVGFKNEGKESYPDTTKEFVDSFNKLIRVSCSRPFKIKAPLINMDKEDIVNLGMKLEVDFRNTFTCYTSNEVHCGSCLACRLRQEGFYWAGVKDPTKYKEIMNDFRG